MTAAQIWQLKDLQERLRLALSNRLTYPRTLVSLARERVLTEEEVQKACECLEACVRIVEAELTLFIAALA